MSVSLKAESPQFPIEPSQVRDLYTINSWIFPAIYTWLVYYTHPHHHTLPIPHLI